MEFHSPQSNIVVVLNHDLKSAASKSFTVAELLDFHSSELEQRREDEIYVIYSGNTLRDFFVKCSSQTTGLEQYAQDLSIYLRSYPRRYFNRTGNKWWCRRANYEPFGRFMATRLPKIAIESFDRRSGI